MKPFGFGIIELLKNNYKPEAHAMNKSINLTDLQFFTSEYQ